MPNRFIVIGASLVTATMAAVSAQEVSSAGGQTNSSTTALTSEVQATEPINRPMSLGLGPLLGEPTGISAKLWLSEKTAVDAGAAWSFLDPDGFQVHGDFLFHKFDLFHVSSGEVPLYFGVGGRVKLVDHGDNRAGIRGPVGISYLLPRSRIEVFAEVAPILDVAPTTSLEWNGGVGLRYYFH